MGADAASRGEYVLSTAPGSGARCCCCFVQHLARMATQLSVLRNVTDVAHDCLLPARVGTLHTYRDTCKNLMSVQTVMYQLGLKSEPLMPKAAQATHRQFLCCCLQLSACLPRYPAGLSLHAAKSCSTAALSASAAALQQEQQQRKGAQPYLRRRRLLHGACTVLSCHCFCWRVSSR